MNIELAVTKTPASLASVFDLSFILRENDKVIWTGQNVQVSTAPKRYPFTDSISRRRPDGILNV